MNNTSNISHGTEVSKDGTRIARTYGPDDAGTLAVRYMHLHGKATFIVQDGAAFHVHTPKGITTFKTLY